MEPCAWQQGKTSLSKVQGSKLHTPNRGSIRTGWGLTLPPEEPQPRIDGRRDTGRAARPGPGS